MPADYNGSWDIVSNDNLDGYMSALGINFATRKIASILKPQKVIKQDGDPFTFQTVSSVLTYESSFKIGEEFEEVTKGMENRKCQSVVNWDNDKMVSSERRGKKTGAGLREMSLIWNSHVKDKFASRSLKGGNKAAFTANGILHVC